MGVAYPSPAIEADLPVRVGAGKDAAAADRRAGRGAGARSAGGAGAADAGPGRIAEMAKEGVPLKTFDLAAPSARAGGGRGQDARDQGGRPQGGAAAAGAEVARPSLRPLRPRSGRRPRPRRALATAGRAVAQRPRLGRPALAPSSQAKPRAVATAPPAPSSAADTPLVDGTGPNGEKLYAAAWQREPRTASCAGICRPRSRAGRLIACRTVADFRVDDCVRDHRAAARLAIAPRRARRRLAVPGPPTTGRRPLPGRRMGPHPHRLRRPPAGGVGEGQRLIRRRRAAWPAP